MPGLTAVPRIVLLDAEAATTAGPAIGLQGDVIQFTGARRAPIPIEVVVTLNSGTSATVIVETDTAIGFGSATTWGTFTLTAAAPTQKFIGNLIKTYIRARPSAHTGGTISAYLTMGG